MDPMDMELRMLRAKELQPQTPTWAQAERLEMSAPQSELWRCEKRGYRRRMSADISCKFAVDKPEETYYNMKAVPSGAAFVP